MQAPPYVCASCAQLVEAPIVINGTSLHPGACTDNYRSGGPLYHPEYLQDLHLAALYGFPLPASPEVVLSTPAISDPLACDGCGCLSNECSPCPACSSNLCLGCQDFHRGHLHASSSESA